MWAASPSCHLDQASGYQFPEGYAYLVTTTYPWVPSGFMGANTAAICYFDGTANGGWLNGVMELWDKAFSFLSG